MDQDPPSQNRSRDLFSIGARNQSNPPPEDLKIRGGLLHVACFTMLAWVGKVWSYDFIAHSRAHVETGLIY